MFKDIASNSKEILLTDHSGGIVQIELNRPENANAYSEEMVGQLVALLDALSRSDEVKVLLISGAGKNFCAGGDVKAMASEAGMFQGDSYELMKRYQRGIQQISLAMDRFEAPTMAMVQGAAVGAGLDLALMCDMRIASVEAKFGETFARLNLIPGDGGAFFLARVVGYAKAMEMILTAELVDAKTALSIGLINKLVGTAELKQEALAMASGMAKLSGPALRLNKRALKEASTSRLDSHLHLMAAYQGILQRMPEHKAALPKN